MLHLDTLLNIYDNKTISELPWYAFLKGYQIDMHFGICILEFWYAFWRSGSVAQRYFIRVQPCYTTMKRDRSSLKTLAISDFPRADSTSQWISASFGLVWPFHQIDCQNFPNLHRAHNILKMTLWSGQTSEIPTSPSRIPSTTVPTWRLWSHACIGILDIHHQQSWRNWWPWMASRVRRCCQL